MGSSNQKTGTDALLKKIERAIAEIEPMAALEHHAAQSILRQLLWCRAEVLGQRTESQPGPFSMGLIATREFDMYGDNPDLAVRLNEIESQMEARAD